jgi:hypothetical protein
MPKKYAWTRPLAEVTGERPRCQYCDKPLRPWTTAIEVVGRLGSPPELDVLVSLEPTVQLLYKSFADWASEVGYQANNVFRLEHITDHRGPPATRIWFWKGYYHGHGRGHDGTVLFCSRFCSGVFAVIAWNAGMIIRREKCSPSNETSVTYRGRPARDRRGDQAEHLV